MPGGLVPEGSGQRPTEVPKPIGAAGGSREGNGLNWQRIAREFRIGTKKGIFAIPESNWNHPTVHAFVEATLDAGNLQAVLHRDQAKHGAVAQYDYVKYGLEPGREVPPGAPGMNPPLSQRYMSSELLMRGIVQILEYGLEREQANLPRYLAGKIGVVTEGYGVEIIEVPKDETRTPEIPVPAVQPGSVWRDFGHVEGEQTGRNLFDLYTARYGSQHFDRWFNNALRQKDTPEDEARCTAMAHRLHIPPEHLRHPTVREFVSNLQDMEDLLQTFEQGEVPPGAPGLHPSVADRYQMAGHLLHVAMAIMEEGFQGRSVDPQFVADHVTSALRYFGLRASIQGESPKTNTVVEAEQEY